VAPSSEQALTLPGKCVKRRMNLLRTWEWLGMWIQESGDIITPETLAETPWIFGIGHPDHPEF